jgi:hypothetical protein
LYSKDNVLFHKGDLSGTLRNQVAQIPIRVDAIPKDQFLASSEEDIFENIISQVEIDSLVIYEDRMEMESRETKSDVSGSKERVFFGDKGPIYLDAVEVTISIPFTGDSGLWDLRPDHWTSVFPHAKIHQPGKDGIGFLTIVFIQLKDESSNKIKSGLDEELERIRIYLKSQKQQVDSFNASLPGYIQGAIKARKEKLKTFDGIIEMLGVPLKRRKDAPLIEPIPIKRKLIRPLPPPPKSGFKPEPGITVQDYEHILSVIRHEGRTFETTPNTYAVHGEEELRDIMLAHLNGHYQGTATGETFRRSGKTDIRIEDQNRAAFVAECKLWRGKEELSKAINQLLGYLTWRDCKTALILFNKEIVKFNDLLIKIPEALRSHQNFKRVLVTGVDGEWRFEFFSEEDESRQVIIHVFIFNLYIG